MDNTYHSKLKWPRISYVVLYVFLASTILMSFSEHNAYAGWPQFKYTAGSSFDQFMLVLLPLVVVGGLGILTVIARRSFPTTTGN